MKCLHMRTNVHMFVHINANRHSSPSTRVQKTASRASAVNGKANDAINDEANMWLVCSSFVLLFASPLAQTCKCSIRDFLLRCVHTDKNLVVRLGTTWLCDIKRVVVVVVWTVWATCVVRHLCCATKLSDQDCEPTNVGPLQKKFVRHNGHTKMLCAI